ncbi:MAG: hypothetical protein ACXWPM_02345 [Bdellovibrionota bacterium]
MRKRTELALLLALGFSISAAADQSSARVKMTDELSKAAWTALDSAGVHKSPTPAGYQISAKEVRCEKSADCVLQITALNVKTRKPEPVKFELHGANASQLFDSLQASGATLSSDGKIISVTDLSCINWNVPNPDGPKGPTPHCGFAKPAADNTATGFGNSGTSSETTAPAN